MRRALCTGAKLRSGCSRDGWRLLAMARMVAHALPGNEIERVMPPAPRVCYRR
ncbi:hypothetical protein K788_0003566 [Paraburkholderia caribensis MBA4]|uniref:Uncharacterized protein n=1 Tax=Paraburkholderia caribensis MBA4 TaxID=1323664 RepID=A0A0P0R6G7_9BURK|nr:hypothetical protein K788_0003566 [Paraburkholderia caribensis MBA4]